MFAILSHKGKQYKVETDKEYKFDLFDSGDKETISFTEVLLINDDKTVKIGDPYLAGASVAGQIVGDIKDKKVTGTKFHAKKHYQRNLGHRQQYTVVQIGEIKS